MPWSSILVYSLGMNKLATTPDRCLVCGVEKMVQRSRVGRLCKPCANRKKSAARRVEWAPIYGVWNSMLARCGHRPCLDKRTMLYYRDLGITVCSAWQESCQEFFKWAVANGWQKGLTIDRIDPTRGYEPGNCQWITQAANTAKRRHPYTVYSKEAHLALGIH